MQFWILKSAAIFYGYFSLKTPILLQGIDFYHYLHIFYEAYENHAVWSILDPIWNRAIAKSVLCEVVLHKAWVFKVWKINWITISNSTLGSRLTRSSQAKLYYELHSFAVAHFYFRECLYFLFFHVVWKESFQICNANCSRFWIMQILKPSSPVMFMRVSIN